MTEQEWGECMACWAMLEFLRGRISARKLWQFACASARELSRHAELGDERWASVELAERYLEGQAPEEELKDSWFRSWFPAGEGAWGAADGVRSVTYYTMGHKATRAFAQADPLVDAPRSQQEDAHADAGERVNAALLRDIVGNPFRPISVDPVWLTPTVRNLARAAYAERHLPGGDLGPRLLGVLGDALEEAGCTNADVLTHLRSPGRHVRGCWAVDLLLATR